MRLLPKLLAPAGVVAALATPLALASAPPVGPLPRGPVVPVKSTAGRTFAVTLPKPAVTGGSWRIARAFDGNVVRQITEATTAAGGVRLTFRAVATGTTSIVFAVTRGERPRAYAARTFRVTVAGRAAAATGCPRSLLPLTANPIGPSVTAALLGDSAANRPQAVGASVASRDSQRGPQVKARCGVKVWQRTVIVYITDRALLPAQSASQRVLFVGRTKSGYRVWQRAH
jgi:predicted secreted protein